MLSWLGINTSTIPRDMSSHEIKDTRYSPLDKSHCHYIEKQRGLFEECFNKLMAVDKVLGMGGGLDALCWLVSGIYTSLPVLAVAGAGAYYLYVTQYVMHQEQLNSFQKQLKEMMDIYRWMAKDSNPLITQDAQFLNVLEAIAPFANSDELILWNLQRTNPNDISDHFVEILSKPPHRIQFVMLKTDNYKQNQENKAMKQNKWVGLFEQTVSELERAAYGLQTKEENQVTYLFK